MTTSQRPPISAESALPARRRILVVDDDPALRLLLSATLAADEFQLREVASAEEASDTARFWRPSVILLDVTLPGMDGLAFCRQVADNPAYGAPKVVLLTGTDLTSEEARAAGACALLRKPFSPLELVRLVDEADGVDPQLAVGADLNSEQLLVYARDLARMIEGERKQRRLLQEAYRQTVVALADALEAKDPNTGHHAQRVQLYALTLTEAVDASLLEDPSLEYGFLLHDFGKIAIPDGTLDKPGPLTSEEWALMRSHPQLGADMLSSVALLQGGGLDVVRYHHERWDGGGYPDGRAGFAIPIGARIFALADALDAITSKRPYRDALPWEQALEEIHSGAGRQFDPSVVEAFSRKERRLRRTFEQLSAPAPAGVPVGLSAG
jgi:ribonuclease P protein subunit RPR2